MPMDPKDIKRMAADRLKKRIEKPDDDDAPEMPHPADKPKGGATVSITVNMPGGK